MATLSPPVAHTAPALRPPRRVLYPHAQWYFLAAMAVTWLGFSQTYFVRVRTEPMLHHVHGMLMGGWIAILIVQPMLYQRGRLRLHRTLGRWAVYLWVPALTVCGLLMDRRMLETHNAPPGVIDQLAFLDLTSLILFPTLIVLSTVFSRRLDLHARYIVCTVVLLMPPALARALFLLPKMHGFRTNVNVAEALCVLTLLALTADDWRRGKIWHVYPIFAATLAVLAVLANHVRDWTWWSHLTKTVAGA